jgi:hypothetical protein
LANVPNEPLAAAVSSRFLLCALSVATELGLAAPIGVTVGAALPVFGAPLLCGSVEDGE